MSDTRRGLVKRLYGTIGRTFIRLDLPADQQPKDSYFELDQAHPNYGALFAMALSAAVNRQRLLIRVEPVITPTETPKIDYLVIDW
jgi:hypothetical protein